VRTFELFTKRMGREFNVFLAKEAGHFEEIGFAQGDGLLAVRARDFPAEIPLIKPKVDATSRA
jgi:hypothetical protein